MSNGLVLSRIMRSGAGGSEADLVTIKRELWGLEFGKPWKTPVTLYREPQLLYGPEFTVLAATTPSDLGSVFSLWRSV